MPSITDNNHLIVKAFATAWRYKNLYERGVSAKEIYTQEHITKRALYKYLSMAYMNPKIVNELLSGNIKMPVKEILEKTSISYNFSEQEKIFNSVI